MRYLVIVVLLGAALVGCQSSALPTRIVPNKDAPFPPTWTPTAVLESTPTSTLVVQPTPTWDGTPPPPSEAYVPRLSAGRLYRSLDEGGAITVVDVRNLAAFDQAHIPQAVHIPIEELEDRIGELDGNNTIVLYCLSPNDALSLQAAMTLYRAGFSQVSVLKGGIQKWYSEGYPVDGIILTPTPRFIGPPWTVTPMGTLTPLATTETPSAAPQSPSATPTGTSSQ
jgi:rhodanese-related sulfurtransferase